MEEMPLKSAEPFPGEHVKRDTRNKGREEGSGTADLSRVAILHFRAGRKSMGTLLPVKADGPGMVHSIGSGRQ